MSRWGRIEFVSPKMEGSKNKHQMSSDGTNCHTELRKRSPGRPEGRTANREEILDAAEKIFAERGYAASRVCDISHAANITQRMVNYYFGTKLALFKEVYLRRGRQLAIERMELLNRLMSETPFNVEDVVRAYLIPPFRLRVTAGGRSFLRLQARLHTEPDELAFELRRETYDRPVRQYVKVLRDLMPGLTEEAIYLRFTQLIGIYLYVLSDAHRIEEISGGKCSMPPSEQMIEEIVAFASAGFHRWLYSPESPVRQAR
jgi:AcrR family transcriptional regulator